MLKRIISIQNVGRFTSLSAEAGDQGNFARLNVIYALNAEGKSTLCDLFRSIAQDNPAYVIGRKRFGISAASKVEILLTGDPDYKAEFSPHGWTTKPEGASPKIQIYDERFVLENVLVGHQVETDQRRSLFGLVIGAQALALEEHVTKAGEAQSKATSNRNIAEATAKAFLPEGWALDAWRTLPVIERVDELVREKDDLHKKAKTAALNAATIRTRSLLSVPLLPAVPVNWEAVLSTSLEATTAGAMEAINVHLEKHQNVDLEWVKRGFEGAVGEECPYCAQKTTGSEVVQLYASIFNTALQDQQRRLAEVESSVRSGFGEVSRLTLKQTIEKHGAEQLWWKESGGLSLTLGPAADLDQIVERMGAAETSLLDALKRKRLNPNQSITPTDAERKALVDWQASVDEIKPYAVSVSLANEAIKQHQSGTISSSVTQLEQELGRLKATQARHTTNAIAALDRLDTATRQKQQADNEKRDANEALKSESIRVFTEYGGRINVHLTSFGVEFRIGRTAVNFTGGKPSGEVVLQMLNQEIKTGAADAADPSKPSLLNTLSSGDKSTLAMAYFLAVLESTPNKADSVVVFDDPFHRQDRARRRRTIERIQEVASVFGQTFVLSHDLDFAREVERIHVDGVRTFMLRHKGNSTLLPVDLPSLATKPHIKDYLTLEEFVGNPSNDDARCRSVVRAMRQALEGYYRVKYPSQFKGADYLGRMVGKIRDAQPDSPLSASKDMVQGLGQVNDYSKTHHHSDMDSDPIVSSELLSYAKQALSIIHR